MLFSSNYPASHCNARPRLLVRRTRCGGPTEAPKRASKTSVKRKPDRHRTTPQGPIGFRETSEAAVGKRCRATRQRKRRWRRSPPWLPAAQRNREPARCAPKRRSSAISSATVRGKSSGSEAAPPDDGAGYYVEVKWPFGALDLRPGGCTAALQNKKRRVFGDPAQVLSARAALVQQLDAAPRDHKNFLAPVS
jgi:hypothetical protein